MYTHTQAHIHTSHAGVKKENKKKNLDTNELIRTDCEKKSAVIAIHFQLGPPRNRERV